MSFLDRIASAVTPAASDEDRREARRKAEKLGQGEPWLATIIDQHKMIEGGFADSFAASPVDRPRAARELAAILTGHSTAERTRLGDRFEEEYDRYAEGADLASSRAVRPQPEMPAAT